MTTSNGPIKTVRLGKTGLKVSRVGLGGIPIQRLSPDKAVEVVQRCLDLGVTFLDMANGYTTSEERIGQAVAGRREGVIIATKTGANGAKVIRVNASVCDRLNKLGQLAKLVYNQSKKGTTRDQSKVK